MKVILNLKKKLIDVQNEILDLLLVPFWNR